MGGLRVAVWGAGSVGIPLAYRLTISPYVSELYWINRSLDNIRKRRIDLVHGLPFAPACHTISACSQDEAARALRCVDMLILVLGAAVAPGENRVQKYVPNAALYRADVIPRLAGFQGIVLVVTNPVDLMARLVLLEGRVSPQRALGLGTVVETARLRAAISEWLSPQRPGREIRADCVGTHDPEFVPIIPDDLGGGARLSAVARSAVLEEVANGARRVKEEAQKRSSIHPIVEGTIAVVEAVASDAKRILTVSVVDAATGDHLFYSVPCTLGRAGVEYQHRDGLQAGPVKDGLDRCIVSLRKALEDHATASSTTSCSR